MGKKDKISSASSFMEKPKANRKGVHSKKNSSKLKSSKNYVKTYRGQGR